MNDKYEVFCFTIWNAMMTSTTKTIIIDQHCEIAENAAINCATKYERNVNLSFDDNIQRAMFAKWFVICA